MTEPAALPLTGERTLPGIWQENYWLRRHEAGGVGTRGKGIGLDGHGAENDKGRSRMHRTVWRRRLGGPASGPTPASGSTG